MISFAKRNLLVFFRDKASVFFSLLSSFVIVGLYVLFLGDMYISSFDIVENARELIDNWVMAGLIATTSVSTTMGAFGIMISDKADRISKDFYSSPIKRKSLALGYVLSAFVIGLVMSIITLIFSQIFIYANGGTILSFTALIKVLFYILLAVFVNSSMMFFITSFFSSNNAFSTASTLIGTLIGFITGVYLPIGMLHSSVQWVIKLFPTSHAAALLRQAMMQSVIKESFKNIPASYLTDFKQTLGVTYQFGNYEMSSVGSIIFILAIGALFFAFALFNLSKKKK